jgi:uncharacterized repeat protein (TIGR01451 family)
VPILRNRLLLSCIAALGIACAAPALAQQKGSLQVKSEVFKEVTVNGADGKVGTRTVPAPHALPGDEVVYITTIKNIGTQPADHIAIDNPIPAELTYKGSTGNSAAATTLVSADGKTFEQMERLQLTGADGVARTAAPADVRFLRWTVNGAIKPGESLMVSYRAVLR